MTPPAPRRLLAPMLALLLALALAGARAPTASTFNPLKPGCGLADWVSKTDDVQRMLRGDPATAALLRRYRVDYVVVGPQEQAMGADPAYWRTTERQVYSNGAYTVYRVG